jgi:glycosyltransferase involved in cell wall biosynthesis
MRIVLLTAGTGSFYCGTCMRDNALVTALCKQGHEALLVPLYLPPMLDEASASEEVPLFFGGINVYLQQKSALFRKTPRWLDRLWDSPGLLRIAVARASMTNARQLGALTLSMLRGEEGNQAKELDRLASWLSSEERVDIVCLSNVLLIGLARRIKQQTGAAIVCTLQGEDSFLDSLPKPSCHQCWDLIAERAADADAFIAVSRYYGDVMRKRIGIPEERLHIVYNGISLDGYELAPRRVMPDPPVLGYLARMCPLKGLDTLVEAYLLIRMNNRIQNLKLRVAGSCTTADKLFVDRLHHRLIAEGLGEDVAFLPNISRAEKIAFLQSLSALSVPATYGESFGLYVVEALAAGVPVVQPRHAVFPELLNATGGGVLCEPDDPRSLASAIEELLSDPERSRMLGERGRQAIKEKFRVEQMAEKVIQVFEVAKQNSDKRRGAGKEIPDFTGHL